MKTLGRSVLIVTLSLVTLVATKPVEHHIARRSNSTLSPTQSNTSTILVKQDEKNKPTSKPISFNGAASQLVQVNSKPGRALARMQSKRQSGFDNGTTSRRNEDPWFLDQTPYPLQPYRFVYNVKGKNGQTEQYRQEVGDGKFLTGSYGYVLPDGIYRHVDYVADERGFRAFIRTSEPGTANENPANVVIAANPVVVAPGATYSRSPTYDPQAAPLPAPTYSIPPASLSDYPAAQAADLGLSSLGRRPPGSIVNTPLRNFTSYALTTLPPAISNSLEPSPPDESFWHRAGAVNNLTQTKSWQPSRTAPSPQQVAPSSALANDWRQSSTGRRDQHQSFLPSTFGLLGHLSTPDDFTAGQKSNGLFNHGGPLQPASRFGQPTSSSPTQRSPPTELTRARNGPDVLTYDRPLSSQGDKLASMSKRAYDNAHLFHPDLPYVSLERHRGLAQLGQLNAAGPSLQYIRPLLSLDAGQLNPIPLSRTSVSSSHGESHSHSEEHRTRHQESHSRQQDAERVTLSRDHESGSRSSTGRDHHEQHIQPALPVTPSEPTGPGLPPPPPPHFSEPQSVKGGARLQPPYAGYSMQQKVQQNDEEGQSSGKTIPQEPTSPVPPSSPVPPEPPQPPITPDQEEHSPDQQQSTTGALKGTVKGQTRRSSKPDDLWSPSTRPVRTPEEFRSSMAMTDLRSMRTTFGLPQPPRLQRSQLADQRGQLDQLVSARMNRVETLLRSGQALEQPIEQQKQVTTNSAASVQRAVAVAANSVASQGDSTGGDAPRRRPQQQQQQQPEERRPMIGLVTRVTSDKASSFEFEGNNNGRGQANNNNDTSSETATAFDARRLSSAAKLQAEKVSELEKFQQRLRTQQLLLEQIKPETKAVGKPLKPLNRQAPEPNSQVSYDEELPAASPNQRDYSTRLRGLHEGNATTVGGQRKFSTVFSRNERIDRGNLTGEPLALTLDGATNGKQQQRQLSELAQKIQSWPALLATSNRTTTSESDKKLSNSIEVDLAAVDKPSATNRSNPNTINLDFINSVTALGVDRLNPFALSSANPAVQSPGGFATSSVRFFSSPELLAASANSEDLGQRRPGSGQRMRSLFSSTFSARDLSSADWPPSNHRGVQAPYERHSRQSMSSVAATNRDGFEIRDRAATSGPDESAGGRFFEVLSASAPTSPSFQAFKDAQLSIPALAASRRR